MKNSINAIFLLYLRPRCKCFSRYEEKADNIKINMKMIGSMRYAQMTVFVAENVAKYADNNCGLCFVFYKKEI